MNPPNLKDVQNSVTNQLIGKLLEYGDRQELSIVEIAGRLGLSAVYLKALIQGELDIRDLPINNIRKISALLGISCLDALMLAGALNQADLIEQPA